MARSLNNSVKLIILLLILVSVYSYSIDCLHFDTEQVVKLKETERQNIKILFVGDIMLDRGVSWYADKNGKDRIFSGVKDLFSKYDIVVGNLEGTITNNESVARKNNKILRFTFDIGYSSILKDAGFDILNLANNHAQDFGIDGYNQTIDNLNNVGIKSFGSPRNETNLSLLFNKNGKDLCFVGYHDLFTFNESPIIEEINKLKDTCDFVTVFTHWGDEYKTKSNPRQQKLAHEFIDSGANLVIGTHPHVVQEIEDYMGKRIFYSLGNFVFDQDFSVNTKNGNAIGVDISDTDIKYEIIPISIDEGRVYVTSEQELK